MTTRLEKIFFYLLVFCLPFQTRHIFYQWGNSFNEWTSIYLYGTDILILAVLIFWLIRDFEKLKNLARAKFSFKKPENILGLFLLVAAFSAVTANNQGLGFYGFFKLLEFSFLFLYIRYNFQNLFSFERFWQVFIASASLQAGVAIWQFFKQKSLGLKFLAESPLSPDIPGVAKIVVLGEKIVRAYGTVPHPNILAAILILAIFGLAYLFIKQHQQLNIYRQISYGALGILLLLALFLTFSRVVTLAGLAFFAWWLVSSWRQGLCWKAIFKTIFLLFIICCFLIIFFWSYFSARYEVSNFIEGQSIGLRIFYNQIALKLIKQNPFLGIGTGNFVWAINDYKLIGDFYNRLQLWMYQPAHNIYLLVAAETGLFGLFAFLLFLFLTIRNAWRQRKDLSVYCLLFIIYCLLIIGLFDHFLWDLQQGQVLFWLFLGLLANSTYEYAS